MLPVIKNAAPIAIGVNDLGGYFTASNLTPGTGVATIAAQSSLVGTAPFLMLIAGANTGIVLDELWLRNTAAGTGGTALNFAALTDDAKAAPTGGVAGNVFNNNHGGGRAGMLGTFFAGPLVAPASTANVRQFGYRVLKASIPAAADTWVIKFGGNYPSAAIASPGVVSYGPISCGPGKVIQLHIWLPSQSAASSWEYDLRGFEFTPDGH